MAGDITNIGKLPPQSLEAEQAVLGAVLLEGESILKAIELLSEEDFYRGSHQKIYRAMLNLFEQNEPIDIVTVSEELKRMGELDNVGGPGYLSNLADQTITSANISAYSRTVKDKSLQRMILRVNTEVAQLVYDGELKSDELMDQAEQKIFEVSEKRIKTSFIKMKDAVKDTFKMIEALYDRKEAITGMPSGFKDLDEYTAGFHPGDLIIVGGRPSSGKTAFGINVAQYIAVEHKKPVAIFSLEMAFRQIILRMLCADAMVDASSIRRGFVKHNFHKLATAAGKLIETRIFVDDSSGISSLEMRAKARRLKREHPELSLVVVDYLQLMKGSGSYEQRVQEISEISRSLKALAKEIDVPVLALSQLNRAVERERRRPNMSDLRESGAIEQDADVILFLYREEKPKNPGEDKRPSAEVINLDIAKQRNGPTGSLQLTFLPRFTRFMDYTPEDFSYAEEEAF